MAQRERADFLQVALEVWGHGGVRCAEAKALEDENAKLEKLLAESILDVSTLREMPGRKLRCPVRGDGPWTGR